MTDVPFGVLLSGGLDSSLVASITARYLAGTRAAKHWGTQLHSFCVGLEVGFCFLSLGIPTQLLIVYILGTASHWE